MSQFGSLIPQEQFEPTQDIPFGEEYPLSPDRSAMLRAGSQNMEQPVFPSLRVGMPTLNEQSMRALAETQIPPVPSDFPGVPSEEELQAIRARQGGMEPLPQLEQEAVRFGEANIGGQFGQDAFDVLWGQVTGEEDRDQRAFAAAYQPTLEQQFQRPTQTQLIAAVEAQKEMQGVVETSWLGIPAIFIKPEFDRVVQNRELARDLRAGRFDSKFVTDHIRNLKIGDPATGTRYLRDALERGGFAIAGTLNTVAKDIPAAALNYVTDGEWAQNTLANAVAWAEYGQSLQEAKLTPNSMVGEVTLDLIETAPQLAFQMMTAGAGRIASTMAGLGRVGAGRVAFGSFMLGGGGIGASSQFNESLATYTAAGMNQNEAVERAFYDASIAFANTTVTSALEGALLGVGSIGSKTNRAIQRAAAATRMRVFAEGAARGSFAESSQEFLDQFGTDFLVNLRREGMPEFREFYEQNPDWVYNVLRNAAYAAFLGGIIGMPAGVSARFRQSREAGAISEQIRTVFGTLPDNHPVKQLFNKDVLTVDDAEVALNWISEQRNKIGKRTAADIEAEKKIGGALEFGQVSDDVLANITIAGNDGTITAPLRSVPEGGRFAGTEFLITPAMAADELARRQLLSGQAAPAVSGIGVRAMPTDVDPANIKPEEIVEWADSDPDTARRLLAQPEPITRRQMEEIFGGKPFQGNNASLRARFKENLRKVVERGADWRTPARIQQSVNAARDSAMRDAIEMLTGLDDIEVRRVALGVSPRQAKAVSRSLADAERESRRITVPTLSEVFQRGQDAQAIAAMRQREEAGMAAAAPGRAEIGRGEFARRRTAQEAGRRATEREQRMEEVVRSTTRSAAVAEAQDVALEALDRVEGVIRGTDVEQAVPMSEAMDAIAVVEELARQAGIEPETALAPLRARTTAFAAVEEYAKRDMTPGQRAAMDSTRRERAARRVADIIVEARRRAVDQYEQDERTVAEDPNYVTPRSTAIEDVVNAPEMTDDVDLVIRSGNALGLELRAAKERTEVTLEEPAPLEEGQREAARQAELRIRERIDRVRRTGTAEREAAPTPSMQETRAAVDAALLSEQEQAEKRARDLRLEQAELRRERSDLADAAYIGKKGKRTKKRKPPTAREKEVVARLEEITKELATVDEQIREIAERRGIVSEAVLEPEGVKETDSFPGTTPDSRLDQIVLGRRQIAEANGVPVTEIEVRYEDGKTKLTPQEKRMSAFGKKLGVTVVFTRGPKGLRTRGLYVKGVVFIRQSDVGSPQAYFSVAVHEAVHHLAATDSEYFTNLYNMLRRKAPRALREMSRVYRAKAESQKNLAAPRNAALQIMSETGPEANARKDALMWLIRFGTDPDYAVLRENPGATLAEMIDSYAAIEGRADAPTGTDEVRGLFADLVRRAKQVNLSVRATQEEEIANLAEMLMDTAFVAAVDEEGKIDLERIRAIADTPRAVGLFGRMAEMIGDVADAIGVNKKERALNEAQAKRLREFMAKPEELSNPKVRTAVQKLVAQSLTHMMDMRRGKVNTEVAPAKPMSEARAAEEIPAVIQSIDMPEGDAAYMAAVMGGDMDTAQRMVIEAGAAAGYKFEVYHGTNGPDFTVFDIEKGGAKTGAESAQIGMFATDNPKVAEGYSRNIGMGGMFQLALGGPLGKVRDEALKTDEGQRRYREFQSAKQDWQDVEKSKNAATRQEIEDALKDWVMDNPEIRASAIQRLVVSRRMEESWWEDPEIKSAQQKLADAEYALNSFLLDKVADALPNRRVLHLLAKIDNPAIYDAEGKTPAAFALTPKIQAAIEAGNDGVIFQNLIDPTEPSTHYVVFRPEQFKSADPVTRDDQGNVIPLSQRFRPESPDIRQSLEAPDTPEFRSWFKDSKIVNADGTPRLMYHGTSEVFEEFNLSEDGLFGPGIYMTSSPESARGLGGDESIVMPLYVSMKNPLVVEDPRQRISREMIERGNHDGIIVRNPQQLRGPGSEEIYVVALMRNQVKHASNQRPTESANIMQSLDAPDVERIASRFAKDDANVQLADIDDADEMLRQSLEDEDSRMGRMVRAANDTARRLVGRGVPTREDRDAIEIVKRPADISPFWKFVAAPLNIAIASKNSEVIAVVEDIIDFDLKRNMLTDRRNRESRTRWESIPKEERNEAEFAKYMDEYHAPDTIDSDPEFASKSQAWRDALKWFKEREEARRQDIIAVKREGIRRALQRDKSSRIVDKAAQNGLEWEVVREGRSKKIRTEAGNVSIDEARDRLAKKMMPDDWGRQYSHFFHWFAGEWKLTAYDADGNRTIIGSAKTEADAFERLYRHRRDNPGMFRKYQAEPSMFVNPDDVVRLSTGQRRRLESMIAQATGASRTDVDDSLRGIVGSKGTKRPFYAPLMERTGAQGFETDFMRVWELSERLHNRWVMGGEMVRQVTPKIEKIRQTMPGWAKYLDETMDHTLFTRPTALEQTVDRFVQSIPVVGRTVSPFFTRRWLGAARALNYGRQLLTVRQQVVNSFQPLQTIYPVLGEQNFAKAVSFYNSPEAKALLERHGRMSADGKFREGSEETIPGVDIGGFLSRMNESVYQKTNGGVNMSSEARNQNFAFVAMYWHATNNLGMGDAEAARYARIYGNVYTQFYYTKANLPWIVRGPIGATALQYRRFMINMTGLMVNEFQKGNYSGVGRYLGTQFLLGGSQAVVGFSSIGLIRSLYLGDKEGADDLTFKMRAWLKDSLGSERAADVAMMGLPAAIGIDLSGSISVWQKPFGRTIYEKAGATFAGPTVNTLLQAYTNLTGETAVPMNPLERGYRAFAETSPTIQQVVAAWKAFNGDNAEYDARGRLKYELDPEQAWIKAGAFRTVDESIWRMEYERLRIIRNEVDYYADQAATQLAVGNTAKAREILSRFNGMYPMAAMTFKDIKRRAEGKRQARAMPQAQRRVELDVGERVRTIAQEEGIGQ